MISVKEIQTTGGILEVPYCDCEQSKNTSSGFCKHIQEWFGKNRNTIPIKILEYLSEEKYEM